MQVSFIIPLYNCLPLTQAMLASLRETLPPGLEHEIILVDDVSTDGTREWLKTVGPALVAGPVPTHNPGLPASGSATIRSLLNEKNLGFAGTCNRGAAAAQGGFLFFLNNDLVLLPGWLEPMLALASRPRAALVGNVQLNAATGAVDHTGIFFNPKGKPEHDTARPLNSRLAGVRQVTALTGACFAIRRQHWQSLGGFDETFVNGCEDIDLCLRARQAGLRNYVSLHSVVRHHISASPGRKARDEHNSRRLLARWRHVIAPLIVRNNCPTFLEVAWDEPRQYPDLSLARDAFLHRWYCTPRPSPRLAQAADAILEIEFHRWAHVLDGAPPPPTNPELVWQLRQRPPYRQPVL